jgi:hypothetical protein
MKTCVLCTNPKEDATTIEVLPATWNGFTNYAEVCGECRESRRFKLWARSTATKTRTRAAAAIAAQVPVPVLPAEIQIAHRTTGALLHTVEATTLTGVNLRGAALSGADLQHASMRGANLQRVDLHLADLGGADLRESDLRAGNLRGADLRGADLRDTQLRGADLSHCLYDGRTRWPAGFDPATEHALRGARNA